MDELRNPWTLALGAAVIVGAFLLLRPRAAVVPTSSGPAPSSGPSGPGPGEETGERQDQIEQGEALGMELQRTGGLEEELDVETFERERFEVTHGTPVGGIRHDARIHQLASTDATIRATRDYFWQTLQDSGAGFFYPGPQGHGALIVIENPAGVFHACALMPTAYAARQNWVQAYWTDQSFNLRDNTVMRADSVSRMHRVTDLLVRSSVRGMSLRGAGSVSQVFEHFPTWWIHHGEHLMRPSEILARSIAVPESQAGLWSLICASEQGDSLGGSPVMSQWVTPLPYLWNPGHGVWVDGDPEATERNILAVGTNAALAAQGVRRLARVHPRTGEPWRCFSFLRMREVPENPAWSFVWWTPWYPQGRDDATKRPRQLPEAYEPHLGGGSELSPAFKQWVLNPPHGLAQTGDAPRGQWVGAIPVGLPQDCKRVGDLVRCELGGADRADTMSPCGDVGGLESLWRIGFNATTCPDYAAMSAANAARKAPPDPKRQTSASSSGSKSALVSSATAFSSARTK